MTENTPEVLNLADMLTGNNFPEKTIDVFVNEALAYQIADLNERIASEPSNEALEAELDGLIEEAQAFRFRIVIQGVPRHDLMAALERIEEQFPAEYSALGRRKPNAEADNAMSILQWVLHIKKIVGPSGAEAGPLSEEEAETLRDQLPLAAIQAVETGISDIIEKTRSGHEALAMESDFLSKR